jgi:methyltransferase-like protein/2-polyprenyl-3-methyl-5-hydroxy-6-metoxy-1,4-benzoquinol methylase
VVDLSVEQVRADYDAVPYHSHAFPQSAPGHLAAIAHLFGLDVPEVRGARVLEIGCAAGGNLIPFAAAHPEAHAVGIDLSQVQIDLARRHVEALGLTNLELLQGDVSSMDLAPLGQFDFIVCHGVYSWVPDAVQEAILAAFHDSLEPTGVAYLSYNIYPGWKAKEIVRDAMLLRGGGKGTPDEKLSFARGMIDFLEGVAPADSVLAKALAEYRAIVKSSRDFYVVHEYLETFNTPCYFLEMVERAKEHDLAYLADAAPNTMFAPNYGDNVAGPLLNECGHSQVLLDQYLDFVVNRAFRQSLFVHADRAPQIRYQLDRSRWDSLHFATCLPPTDGQTRLDDSSQEFGERSQPTLVTQNPAVKASLEELNARWPSTLSRQELIDAVHARLEAAGIQPAANPQESVDDLLAFLIARGQVRYRLDPVLLEPPSAPPRLDETVRRMAELARGNADAWTFNAWHETVQLSHVDGYVLPLLDGTRGRDALVEALLEFDREDLVRFERDGQRLSGQELRTVAAQYVEDMPQRLVSMKLFRGNDRTAAAAPS